jgi:hypothetical protein
VKRLADQTLYEILEIPQDASPAAVEAAVERAKALYGPGSLATYTLMSPDEAAALIARIDEAHSTLLDPEARKRYDASLAPQAGDVRAAVNGFPGGNGVDAVSGTNVLQGPTAPVFTPVPVIPPLPAVAPPRPPEPEAVVVQSVMVEPVVVPSIVVPPPEPPAAPPPPHAAPPPARAPILLEREVPPPPVAAPAPALEATPAPPPPAEPEVPMPEGALWTGEALRRVREARGLTVPQIAERTKVTRHHVENIEAERFGALPAPVYLRGILLSLARELRLDGQKVARAYLDRAAASGQMTKPR